MKTLMSGPKHEEGTEELDHLLASVGLHPGRRKTLAGSWRSGERTPQAVPQIPAKPGKDHHPAIVQVEGWASIGWLRHGFSTRSGGISSVYDASAGGGSLNLGWTKEDEPANVVENRLRFLREAAGTSPAKLLTIKQFHSGMVRIAEKTAGPLEGRLESADGRAVLRGDGMMTDIPGLMLGVQVADCVPVLVADVKNKAVAAFHAGWRGTLARIVERGIGTMRIRYGSRPKDLVAAIGPSIGPCCYAVGEELRHDFDSQFAYAPNLFSEVYDSDPVRDKYPLLFLTARAPGHSNIGPQVHLNLWEANRRQLLDAGLKPKAISVVGECTACTRIGGKLKYFSHRGESGFAGRMMGVVGIAG